MVISIRNRSLIKIWWIQTIIFIVRCMVKQRHLSGVVIMTALNSQAQREQILCKKHNIEALNKIFSITGTVTVSHLLDQLCNIKTLWFPWCSRAKPNLSTHHCALFYFNTGIDSFFQPSCAFKQCFITSPCSLCSIKTSLLYNMTDWLCFIAITIITVATADDNLIAPSVYQN